MHRHGMRRHDLLELTAQLIQASISVDCLVDPRLVHLPRHPPLSLPGVSTPSLSGTRPYPEWSPLRYAQLSSVDNPFLVRVTAPPKLSDPRNTIGGVTDVFADLVGQDEP